jgi:hypothetical protein
MKLSEAILLGDVILPRGNGRKWLDDGCGCAVGRAYLANGGHRVPTEADFIEMWPWLDRCVLDDISEKFLFVVWGEMTFDRLVEYVRSIEPEEEAACPEALIEVAA